MYWLKCHLRATAVADSRASHTMDACTGVAVGSGWVITINIDTKYFYEYMKENVRQRTENMTVHLLPPRPPIKNASGVDVELLN
ncbi:hypothetical protein NECAME_01511 [Necator americanus]|uniref:Uncharacterized protein n=1 Tax=Necator americanus TaxID=51031 RepID=W2TTG4_NECAM|nr:hypothetical protein NECAME_01511 [Necator americanus]ETN84949.1 hypothetical protein NECAME_01511 [Necator americanus]